MDSLDIEKIEIKVRLAENGGMLAQVQLTFGIISIRGYRVMKSKFEDEKLYVLPPSAGRVGGNYVQIVRIEDQEVWSELERLIIAKYSETVKSHEEYLEDDVTIDPKDIPF